MTHFSRVTSWPRRSKSFFLPQMVGFSFNPSMKNFLFLLLLVSFTSHAGISIISDLDDTIKITEASGNPEDLLGDKVYAGMPEFLQGARSYTESLVVLSASPAIIKSHVEKVLRKHKIAINDLILRKNIFEDKFDYKVRKIEKVLENSQDDFILIGDDIGQDPEAYEEINRLYPGRILAVYIHVVHNRELPAGTVTYWTSFDLYLREFLAHRMTERQVIAGGARLMKELDMEMIFPKKAACPTDASVWEWQTRTIFSLPAQALTAKILATCKARQSDNILL